MPGGQIAPGFTPFIKEIIHKLRDEVESYTARWIYIVLAVCFTVDEDFDTDGAWAEATVRASKSDIINESGVSEGSFYRAWPQLLESGLVVEREDGTIALPMYKLKKYDVFSLRLIDERITRLEKSFQSKPDPSESSEYRTEGSKQPGKREQKEGKIRENEGKGPQNEGKGPQNEGKGPQNEGKGPQNEGKIPQNEGKIPQNEGRFAEDILLKGFKIKNSLSTRKVISYFYTGIGQKRISREKRERAERIFRKLRKDGFTPEDIAFAVVWTLENAKEQPYDFSIIQHTIGQAIAAREKAESEAKEIEERDRKAAEERERQEREERQREEIETLKESLSPEERAKLHERAEAELRESGEYKPQFITELLIEIKENEILRKKLTAENGGIKEADT